MAYLDRKKGKYSISTNPKRLDLDAIQGFLSRSFWAEGIPKKLVAVRYGDKEIGPAGVRSNRKTQPA